MALLATVQCPSHLSENARRLSSPACNDMSIRRALGRSFTFPTSGKKQRQPRQEQLDPKLAPFPEETKQPGSPQPELILVHPVKHKQSHAPSIHSETEQVLALRAEIAICDEEEAELRLALAHVRARKYEAIGRLHALVRTPANLLAPSVLALIFSYLDIHTIESKVMLISRRWRRTALSLPQLWNTIQLTRGPVCAKAYIKRARGLPLIVELDLPEPLQGEQVNWALSNLKRPGDADMLREREIERLFAPVLPFISNWAALRVHVPDVFSMQKVLSCCAKAGGTKVLKELELVVTKLSKPDSSASDFEQIENALNLESESLHWVTLTNMAWQWSPYALGSVSELTISLTNTGEAERVFDLPSYFGTLVGAASLRTLTINISGNVTVSLLDEATGDGSPTGPSTPSAIVLPFLSHLILNGTIPPTLLRLFNTPALRRLDLNLARRSPTPRLPRGHRISDLRLEGAMPNIRLLQSLPELVKLELGRDTPGRLVEALALHSEPLDPEQTPIAPGAVVPYGEDQGGREEALCPLLDTLTLRGCERIQKDTVHRLVERRGGSLRRVRMIGCEAIGLKGELRRTGTGTWTGMGMASRSASRKRPKRAGTDVILKSPKLPPSRRDTDSGFVVVNRDSRREEMVTG